MNEVNRMLPTDLFRVHFQIHRGGFHLGESCVSFQKASPAPSFPSGEMRWAVHVPAPGGRVYRPVG